MSEDFPIVRPVGASALLVELGDRVDDAVNTRVIALDRAIRAAGPPGLVETVPAYASLMLVFDPLASNGVELASLALALARRVHAGADEGREHIVPVAYDGPDLDAVARAAGLSAEAVADTHRAGRYRVHMYGFAPGYAYLAGVPATLHLPRKPAAERGHPVGSVIIAGAQCLITTLAMPTGWWVIGRTPLRVLDAQGDRPFRFDPGDRVRFERVPAADLPAA